MLNAKDGRMVQAREEHRIGVTERSSEERRRRWAVFRACGNSFVRKTRGDGIYDDEEREAVDRLVGRMNERRRERRKCEGAHRVESRRR